MAEIDRGQEPQTSEETAETRAEATRGTQYIYINNIFLFCVEFGRIAAALARFFGPVEVYVSDDICLCPLMSDQPPQVK